MTEFAAAPLEPTEQAMVLTDIPCRKCGYNLRGLGLNAQCPECGAAVRASISGDLLRNSDPNWVRRLAQGTKLMIAGIVFVILGTVAASVLMIAVGPKFGILPALGGFVGNLLMVAGSWLLTEPDPSGVGEDRYGTARKVIRFSLLVGVLNSLLGLAVKAAPLPPAVFDALRIIGTLAGIVGVVGLIAQFQYLEKLADRIPAPALSRRAGFLKLALPISYGVILIGSLSLIFFVKGGALGASATGVSCFLGVAGIALLIFGLMYVGMIVKFNNSFREQAILAERNWSAATITPGSLT